MKDCAALGGYVLGRITAVGVPAKIIILKSGVHQSTFSRFINGRHPVSERQLLDIGIAIGEAQTEARTKK